MAKKVRLGIIGTSNWAELLYLSTLRDCPDAELVALCGRNVDRLSDLAERFGIPGRHTDYRDLLARGDLDAVAVVVPDDLHKEVTLAAVDHGLHVLCEKPLANTATDAREMLDAATRAGVRHMVMFTWRWQPHFQYVKSLIADGALGRLYRTQIAFITNFAHDGLYQWRLDPMRANGVLGDLGSHMFDLSRWLCGDEIVSVSSDLGTAVSRTHIAGHDTGRSNNDFAHVVFRYASGCQGVVDVTNVSHDGDRIVQHVLRIEGETASLELDHVLFGAGENLRMRIFKSGGATVEVTVPAELYGAASSDALGIYSSQPVGVRGFASSLRNGTEPAPSFDDGWRAQILVDAALLSNAERRWVDVGYHPSVRPSGTTWNEG
ncbi:Gfo/Idh/MocA family protein [Devosia sp. CN2-171]|uniref:Gfo/Idh/MocA family protein n=1 Tax=Devosia sp. CN2-171 TaxID=3400909 RepID=UPI003BF8F884